MAVRDPAAHRSNWKRLVGIVFLLLSFRVNPLEDIPFRVQRPGGDIQEYTFLGVERILRSGCSRFYSRPEAYLLFLPGPLACGLILFVRRKRGIAVLLVSVVLLGAADVPAPFPRRTVERGVEAFAAGDYEGARSRLEEAETVVSCNAALRYDIALCYYVLDHRGDAVYFLRESIRANPQLKLPRLVLRRIEEDGGLNDQAKPPMAMHPNIPFGLTLFFANLSFVGLGFLLSYRRGWIFILLVFSALLAVAALSLFIRSWTEIRKPVAVVTAEVGALKKIPLPGVKPWMALPEGSALKISGEADDYLLVKTGGGLTGWIDKAAVRGTERLE